MRILRVLLLVPVLVVGLSARTDAASISLFMNGSFVDAAGEGANLQASLTGLGHTVTTFTGITAADFTAAGAGGKIIIFPEMEVGNLLSALDAAAIAALQGYVSGGGGIIQANLFPGNSNLPNSLFGWGLVQVGNIGATSLNAGAAAGTAFAGGPAGLPGANAVEGVLTASLPGGALNLYSGGLNTSVFAATFGAGHYVYIGYDWFSGSDAAFNDVLNRAIGYAATVPEPATLLLVGSGLAYAIRRRRAHVS